MGGKDKEVAVDIFKLSIRNSKGINDEHLLIGFLEKETKQTRAFLAPNIKVQTIAKYISKVVAYQTTLYTPFYADTGFEFLFKYFDHKRMSEQKSKEYTTENNNFRAKTGFRNMQKALQSLELTFLRN